jgi:CheY-like chemotaxis protein
MVDAGQRTVLIVDDDEGLRGMLSDYFGAQGFEVLVAANGLESLLHVKRARPGAIVLDLNMPRLGGLDALKRIHAFDPAITVVVITGDRDPETQRRALALGAAQVLTKPFELTDLLQALGGPEQVPARRAEAGAPAAGEIREPAGSSAGKILIVDDEADVRSSRE